eukprot:scaffold8069_cov52-Attheya_sp.AAC.9
MGAIIATASTDVICLSSTVLKVQRIIWYDQGHAMCNGLLIRCEKWSCRTFGTRKPVETHITCALEMKMALERQVATHHLLLQLSTMELCS